MASQITVLNEDGDAFNGEVLVEEGKPTGDVVFEGYSLVHSAPLTTIAFTRGFLGESGKYIVSIGLLLFAFSTAISWSYYGDRAMTFLFGSQSVRYFRMVLCGGIFFAAFTDTQIIWTLSGICYRINDTTELDWYFPIEKGYEKYDCRILGWL